MAKGLVATGFVHDARFHIILFEVVPILFTCTAFVCVDPSTFKEFRISDLAKIDEL